MIFHMCAGRRFLRSLGLRQMVLTCTLLGVVIEKIAYTPLRSAPRISLLITAIGVSFFLEYTAELVMGSGAKVIPSYYDNKTFYLGKVPLGLTSIITLAVTVLSMLVLTFLVQKTKLGKAMRAVSEDMDEEGRHQHGQHGDRPVSYTHLDAAKGQTIDQLAEKHCHGWILPFFPALLHALCGDTLFYQKSGDHRGNTVPAFSAVGSIYDYSDLSGASITGRWKKAGIRTVPSAPACRPHRSG